MIVLLTGITSAKGQYTLGAEQIIANQLYVVHSWTYLSSTTTVANTSNIYVIKGSVDTVWIFGCGYGDNGNVLAGDTSDHYIYTGNVSEPARNAIDDARDVDSIITNFFGLTSSTAQLMFIVPHYHLDHINKELIASFADSLTYSLANTKIFVHINDYAGSICNLPCCDSLPCSAMTDVNFGVPFHRAWTPFYTNKFVSLGNPSDPCNQIIGSFTTALGNWTINKSQSVANGGHTDGCVNLHNQTLQYRINGGDGGTQCPVPNGWTVFPIHGNSPLTGINDFSGFNNVSIHIFPNPFSTQTVLQTDNLFQNATLIVYNLYGQTVKQLKSIYGQTVVLSRDNLASGLYFVRLTEENKIIVVDKLVITD